MKTTHTWRIGAVPYLNVAPLVWEIERYEKEVVVIKAPPRTLAKMLNDRIIDVGILPTYEYLTRDDYSYVPKICISSNGPVKSVKVYCSVPIERARSLLLTQSSKTSVALFKILIKERFRIAPSLTLSDKPMSEYSHLPSGYDGYLVIGDLAMRLEGTFPYAYDLGEEWKEMTGLPFVFALWAYPKEKESKRIIEIITDCKNAGMANLNAVAEKGATATGLPFELCYSYLSETMEYVFDSEKKVSMARFKTLLLQHEINV